MRVTRACALGANAAAVSNASASQPVVRVMVSSRMCCWPYSTPGAAVLSSGLGGEGIATMAKRHRAPKRPRTAPRREWPLFRSLAGYRIEFLTGDLVAGLTLAAIAIPEQMATAGLGHFEAQAGLVVLVAAALAFAIRSDERRVGKECRSRWSP